MAAAEHTCKNCSASFEGNYCNQCGEKVYSDHDKSVGHILEEGLHFITHFEGKFFTTLKTILFNPGKLSIEYCGGIRKKYFAPLSFFLLLVILYLLFPILKGLNMELKNHMASGVYGQNATGQVYSFMKDKNVTFEQVSERFHNKSEKVSKFLLFIVIPYMALLCWALFYKKRKLFFDHFIFSTEMASFFLLWGFLLFPALLLLFMLLIPPLEPLFNNEWVTGLFIIIPFAIYTGRGGYTFYKLTWLQATIFGLAFISFFMYFVLTIYKFLLFFITWQLI